MFLKKNHWLKSGWVLINKTCRFGLNDWLERAPPASCAFEYIILQPSNGNWIDSVTMDSSGLNFEPSESIVKSRLDGKPLKRLIGNGKKKSLVKRLKCNKTWKVESWLEFKMIQLVFVLIEFIFKYWSGLNYNQMATRLIWSSCDSISPLWNFDSWLKIRLN